MSTVERRTRIGAPAADVWARATSIEGVNHELGPWMRMTVPRHLRDATLADLPIGVRVARSWILFLGVLPFDYDDLTLLEVQPGRRFLERSPMGSMRLWQHERVVEPDGARACTVTDRLTFEPRVAATGGLVTRIVKRTFAHRHRRLAAWFAR